MENTDVFLLNSALKSPYPVALAALLPCFWLYGEVGQHVITHQVANNPYQRFIDTYVEEAYERVTVQFIQLLEKYGQQASESTKKEMKETFLQSALLEYLVFEEAGSCNLYALKRKSSLVAGLDGNSNLKN